MNRPPKHATIDIPSNGAAARVQLSDVPCSSVTLQAHSSNTGAIFIGDHTVTNAGGANPGIKLSPGQSIANIGVQNLNWIYAATETNGNDVTYLLT